MLKIFKPYVSAKNVYEIDINFFIKNNIKYVICDLDNTLEAFYTKQPSEQAHKLFNDFKKAGIKFYIVSNNKMKRVKEYADILGCEYISEARKPLKNKTKKFINLNKINTEQCIIIGDQVLTDIVLANRLKIKSILCENLVEKDQLCTKINKFFDKNIRKKLIKKGELINWRSV